MIWEASAHGSTAENGIVIEHWVVHGLSFLIMVQKNGGDVVLWDVYRPVTRDHRLDLTVEAVKRELGIH